ncbi:MAG: glycosyltransferase [Verrucomicrobiota bacterium]
MTIQSKSDSLSARHRPVGPTRVSVVTPSFKQVNYLICCAASVRDQTGDFTVEHLIHDGGSGGDFDHWALEQASATCVSEKDDGMYDAINRGFRKASGEIIAWLNCDEQYLPGTLQRVARFFDEHPGTDILFGDIILVDDAMAPLAYRRAVMPTLGHIRYSHLSTFSAATFVRRRVLDEGHFLDTRWKTIADAVWIGELLEAGYRAATLHQPLSVFCMLGTNLGQSALLFAERREWERETGATGKWRKLWYIMQYRLERLRVGAYWTRKVMVSAYRPGFPDRVTTERWVSGRWSVARDKAANLRSRRNVVS